MRKVVLLAALLMATAMRTSAGPTRAGGNASWYGEAHRGRLMANGQRFDPDQLTAASWFYPLGTKVRVTLKGRPPRNVVVTITDRGPSRELLKKHRLIDLSQAAFKRIADPRLGLVAVRFEVE